jgi:hypothetical protein
MYSALHSHPFFLMLLLSSVVLYPCIDLSIKRWNSKYLQNSLIWFKSFSDLYLVYSDILHLQMTRVIFYSVGYYLLKCLPEGLAYILLILQSLACLGRGSGPKEQRGEGSLRMLSYFQMWNYIPFELQIEFIWGKQGPSCASLEFS